MTENSKVLVRASSVMTAWVRLMIIGLMQFLSDKVAATTAGRRGRFGEREGSYRRKRRVVRAKEKRKSW